MIDWMENGPKNILNNVLDIFVYFVINVHWIIIDQYIGIKNRWLGPKLFKVQVGIGGNFSIFCNTITKATLFTHVHKASTRKFYGQKIYSGKSMASKRYTDREEKKNWCVKNPLKDCSWYDMALFCQISQGKSTYNEENMLPESRTQGCHPGVELNMFD